MFHVDLSQCQVCFTYNPVEFSMFHEKSCRVQYVLSRILQSSVCFTQNPVEFSIFYVESCGVQYVSSRILQSSVCFMYIQVELRMFQLDLGGVQHVSRRTRQSHRYVSSEQGRLMYLSSRSRQSQVCFTQNQIESGMFP